MPLLRRLLSTDPRTRLSSWTKWIWCSPALLGQSMATRIEVPGQTGADLWMSPIGSRPSCGRHTASADGRRGGVRGRVRRTQEDRKRGHLYDRAILPSSLEESTDGAFVIAVSNGGPSFSELWLPSLQAQLRGRPEFDKTYEVNPSIIVVHATDRGPQVGALFIKLFIGRTGDDVTLMSIPVAQTAPPSPSYLLIPELSRRYTAMSGPLPVRSLEGLAAAQDFLLQRAERSLAAIADYLSIVVEGNDPATVDSWEEVDDVSS